MKIGPVHVTWQTSRQERILAHQIRRFLAVDETGRQVVARMARSEVKNALAEIAEEAGVPFGDPAEFVKQVAR